MSENAIAWLAIGISAIAMAINVYILVSSRRRRGRTW
jgi:heme exporter protein D